MGFEPLFYSLPEHWEVVSLGEACKRGGGNIQTGPFGSQLHAADYVPVGVPSIMPKNIGDNRIDPTDIAKISKQDAERLSRYLVKVGDIVYSRRGDIERRALIREQQDGWLCGTGCLRVRLSQEIVNPLFASYYLGHPIVRNWIVRHAVGATMLNLNTSILEDLPFIIPPLDEQKAIAHILGTLDDKIELNQQMNRTLEGIARAIFKSWFIDFDPVRAKMDGRQPAGMDAETAALFPGEFEDSPLGKIPKGWKVEKIEDIATRVAMGPFGSRITSDNFISSGVPVIRGSNLVGGFNEDNFVYLTDEKADELKSSVAFPGDIVFTHRGTLGQVGIIPQKSMFTRYVVSQSQMLLSVDKKQVSPKLVYNFFCSPLGQQALLANTNTTGVPSIARPSTSLKAIPLVIPPKEISNKFEIFASSLDAQRELNIQVTRNLVSIRDTLLPKLLSGEIQIKDAEKILEEVT
jgi:type I restriction enzyme S subunit